MPSPAACHLLERYYYERRLRPCPVEVISGPPRDRPLSARRFIANALQRLS